MTQRALCELSKSEKYKAVVHTKPNDGPKGETKYYLEIWSEGKSIATFDLTALDLHGAVYTDGKNICLKRNSFDIFLLSHFPILLNFVQIILAHYLGHLRKTS